MYTTSGTLPEIGSMPAWPEPEDAPDAGPTCSLFGTAPVARYTARVTSDLSPQALWAGLLRYSPLGDLWPIRSAPGTTILFERREGQVTRFAYTLRKPFSSAGGKMFGTAWITPEGHLELHLHIRAATVFIECNRLTDYIERSEGSGAWVQTVEIRRRAKAFKWTGKFVARDQQRTRTRAMETLVARLAGGQPSD